MNKQLVDLPDNVPSHQALSLDPRLDFLYFIKNPIKLISPLVTYYLNEKSTHLWLKPAQKQEQDQNAV